MSRRFVLLAVFLLATASASGVFAARPDFSLEVRPILSAHCFKCHGPDDKVREAGLRLDKAESATSKLESGAVAITLGKPAESELIKRINSGDPDEQMPPPKENKPLSDREKRLLSDWIAAGAVYKPHWAFVPPKQAPLPAVNDKSWPKNPIDYFILARLEAEKLHPSPPADRYTLLRRVYLDLVGYPPTPQETDEFIKDETPGAYEKVVDRLLASPHYGERWARRWLDLARYADTNGYEKDAPRTIWPYRDWVIKALNADMPFDQFSIEQLAGDMLDHPTADQRIATGFHRNSMLNEEGGNDPQEFRYYSIIDRANVTGTIWLGLTVGCANCHTHKFDPITHSDYFRLVAFLNNADEPKLDIPDPAITKRRQEIEDKIAAIESDLPNRFPAPPAPLAWAAVSDAELKSAAGAKATRLADGSFLLSGNDPDKDTYTATFHSGADNISAIRVEALVDPALPSTGPGRTPHGNFVLSEISVAVEGKPAKLTRAVADGEQQGFPAAHAIDGNPATGWAIQMTGKWNVNRAATFFFEKPQGVAAGAEWSIKLDQQYGSHHTLGRLRLSLGRPLEESLATQARSVSKGGSPQARSVSEDSRSVSKAPEAGASAPTHVTDDQRKANYRDERFAAWLAEERQKTNHWRMLTPKRVEGNVPALSIEPEGVVFVGGDKSKHEQYTVQFSGDDLTGVTALRLETLPDPRLPEQGPGRVDYEGPHGTYFLSEIQAFVGADQMPFASASETFAKPGSAAVQAIDGDFQSGWSNEGAVGKRQVAVFTFKTPLPKTDALKVILTCDKYFAAGLGKFRIWATTDPTPGSARELPGELEPLVLSPPEKLSADDHKKLLQYFCTIAPELAAEHAEIKRLRDSLPGYTTTLVMQERRAEHLRPTFIHKRGEFLRTTDPVTPEILSIFPPLPKDSPHDRLALARWLVSRDNPLVARVTVNRQWQVLFGRGLVRTTEDFGYQGDPPTHPELLDWLAVEFMNDGWSLKKMHKLIVMSATYQQSSAVTPELLAIDPDNRLLGRAPRVRMEAEQVRDSLLRISGLLSEKIGGPSVFPPQPPSVTTEAAYGQLAWNVSPGEDRYRRGLYTFSKRSAPYAMFNTFDAPSGETCLARREVSDTPLQALSLENDVVAMEAAQALAVKVFSETTSDDDRLTWLVRRCLARPPAPAERELLKQFFTTQQQRLRRGELDAAKIVGTSKAAASSRPNSVADLAAWTLTARALINLDETVTKE